MSLNNIELPGIVVADLYKKALVDIPGEEMKKAPVAEMAAAPDILQEIKKTASIQEAIETVVQPNANEAPPAVKEVQPASKETLLPTPLQYLGNNLKKVAIVVHYPEQVYLPEEQLNFLTAVLKACQLNMGDIAIINKARQQVDFATLLKDLQMRQLILFGNMQEIVNDTQPFVIKAVDGVSVLASPALETLNVTTPEGKVLKGNLWGCLKQLFNV